MFSQRPYLLRLVESYLTHPKDCCLYHYHDRKANGWKGVVESMEGSMGLARRSATYATCSHPARSRKCGEDETNAITKVPTLRLSLFPSRTLNMSFYN